MPWQRKAWKRLDTPGDFALSMARANGKSAWASIVAGAYFDPVLELAPKGSDIILVAASHRQTRIVYQDTRRYLEQVVKLGDRKRYRIADSLQHSEIRDLKTGRRVLAIGSDPKRAMGLRPALIVCDEVTSWPTVDEMIAALDTAKAKMEARIIYTGTRPPAGSGHPFEAELQKERAICYAAEEDEDPFRAAAMHRANPSMKFWPHLAREVKKQAKLARESPEALARYLQLHLNLGGIGVAEEQVLSAGTWTRCEGRTALRSGRPVLGLDLSTTQATGAAVCWPATGAADGFLVFPRDPDLMRRGKEHNVGSLYEKMRARKELSLHGTFEVDVGGVLTEAFERWGVPAMIVADRWREASIREALATLGQSVPLKLRGMGFKDGANDLRRLRLAAADWLAAPTNLALRVCLANAKTATDEAGNAKIRRTTLRRRDDLAVALALCVAEAHRRRSRPSRRLRSAVV